MISPLRAYFPAFALLCTGAITAQNWILRSSSGGPAPATFCRMAYDIARGRCVLFGGWDAPFGNVVFDQTWEWNGTVWQQQAPATVPNERESHVMAYDAARSRTVMFGGWDFNFVYLGQTWEWDGVNWVDRQPANAPSGRTVAVMAYDSLRGVTVLFGGRDAGGQRGDTWEWDGTNWTPRTFTTSPSPRTAAAMTFDAVRGRMVLFGGFNGSSYLGDTWEYDGANWFQVVTDGSPKPRRDAHMVFDGQRGRCVLFGGDDGPKLDDTWEYGPNGWRQLWTITRPQPNAAMGMAYDVARARSVFFGGFNAGALGETWELGGNAATYRTFGTACVGGANRTPVMEPVFMPTIGTTTRIDIKELTLGGGVAVLVVGLSDTTFGGAPLPVDLAPIGMPGCRAYVSVDATLALTHTVGGITWTFAVPNNPALSGQSLYLQTLSIDGGAPRPFPGAMSNAAEMNIR
jgi:hypothetical protein